MKTIKAILAAVLVSSLLPVTALANTSVQQEIQDYTNFIQREYNVAVFAKVQSTKALRDFEKLDLFLDGKIQLKDESIKFLSCSNPVCENTGGGQGGEGF